MGDPFSDSDPEAMDAAPPTSTAPTLDDATIKASDLAQRGLDHYTTPWSDDSIPDAPDASDIPNAPLTAPSFETLPRVTTPADAASSFVTLPYVTTPSASSGAALTLMNGSPGAGPDALPSSPADPVAAAQRDYQSARQVAGQSMLATRQKLLNLGFTVPDDALADPAALHTAIQSRINAALADPSANQISPFGPARLTPQSQALRNGLADLGNRAASIISDHAGTLDDLRSSYSALQSASQPPTTRPPTSASPDRGSASQPPTASPPTSASPDRGSASRPAPVGPQAIDSPDQAAASQPLTTPSQPITSQTPANAAQPQSAAPQQNATSPPAPTAPPSPAAPPPQRITGLSNLLWRTDLTTSHTFEKSIEGVLQWSKALPDWAEQIMPFAVSVGPNLLPVGVGLQKIANQTNAIATLQRRTQQQEAALRGEPVMDDSGKMVQLDTPSTGTRVVSNVVGGLVGSAPGIVMGGIPGLLTLGTQTAASASAEAQDQTKAAGGSDSAAAKAGFVAALKTLPSTLLFAGAGGLTGKILKNIVPLEASPLTRAAVALVTGSAVNVAAGAGGKILAGENRAPTLDDLVHSMIFAAHGAASDYQFQKQLATAQSILTGQHPQVAIIDGIAEGAGGRYTPEQQAQARPYAQALRAVAADFLQKARGGRSVIDHEGPAAASPADRGGAGAELPAGREGSGAESGPYGADSKASSGLTSQSPPVGQSLSEGPVPPVSTSSQSFPPSNPAAPRGQSSTAPDAMAAPPTPPGPERAWGVTEADKGTRVASRSGITGTLGDANSQRAAIQDANGNYHLFDAADVRPAAPNVPRGTAANPNTPANPGPWGEVTDAHRGLPIETRDGRTGTLAAGPLPNTPNPNVAIRDAQGKLQTVPQAETRLAGSVGGDAPPRETRGTPPGAPAQSAPNAASTGVEPRISAASKTPPEGVNADPSTETDITSSDTTPADAKTHSSSSPANVSVLPDGNGGNGQGPKMAAPNSGPNPPVASLGKNIPTVRNAAWFENVAAQATRNPSSDTLVLGHFSRTGTTYTKVAAHYGASYLKIENWGAVTKGLSQNEIWMINETFLKQQIRQGKEILFSHDPQSARRGSFFEREVDFLRHLGYHFQLKNQWTWEAVR
ncbi:hypothetical protein CfE428DRAFT_5705 [Chthoniobacter flavus Ellin428]|uniref:Uncharacterized protein n=1 Tax=Chthoniobacter flavus Ellin428 TaxID=497964 RepID=B4D9Y8_9BACT|nr:hypothetical protein [Chthoniobacter flavus]EDY16742.1 hypothetical protein CfE428DRAFT_5705 [Chthoniobacter flavus Ellin428]TCO87860.1 hypothetical protein EV701_120159 [Chthoniobacter flavus]